MAKRNAMTQKAINRLPCGQHAHIWFNGKSEAAEWDADKVRKMTFKRSAFLAVDIKILPSMENLHFVVNMV